MNQGMRKERNNFFSRQKKQGYLTNGTVVIRVCNSVKIGANMDIVVFRLFFFC